MSQLSVSQESLACFGANFFMSYYKPASFCYLSLNRPTAKFVTEELKSLVELQEDDYSLYSTASRLTLVKEISRMSEESSDYRARSDFKV